MCGRDLEASARRAQLNPSAVPYDNTYDRRRYDDGNTASLNAALMHNNIVMMNTGKSKPVEATITEPTYGSWGGSDSYRSEGDSGGGSGSYDSGGSSGGDGGGGGGGD